MSLEPQMPRDEDHPENDASLEDSPETADTHIGDDDESPDASVLGEDEDDGATSLQGAPVVDVPLWGANRNPLQGAPPPEWAPGQPETFSGGDEPETADEAESQEFSSEDQTPEPDADAPTVVIKGMRPDGAPPNPEFEAATEPLPAPNQEMLDFTPPEPDEKEGIEFPRDERPDALPLPAFEPLAPPSLDTSAPKAPAATTPPPVSEPPSEAPVGAPEEDSGLKLPSLASEPLAFSLDSSKPAAGNPPSQETPSPVAGQPAAASSTTPTTTAATSATNAKPSKDSKPTKGASGGGINLGQVILISYASAVTLILIMMLMQGNSTRPHHLESLPDVAPEPEGQLSYVPINADLAPGHQLRIGEKRRFGNIEVEVLRVTHEPIEFAHYSGNPGKKKPVTAPVLKLWLRFTNVSKDQTIAPLDRTLLLRWVAKAGGTTEFSNQYLFPAKKQDDPEAVISTYRMPQTSDWDLVGQSLDRELAPGESYETFIPSADDGTAEVNGPIVWRVQMRKGYSPKGYGVTTVFEVDFDRKEVQQS